MKKRDLVWLSGLNEDDWIWCPLCERAFQVKDIRWVPVHELATDSEREIAHCAYEDCIGMLVDFASYHLEVRQTWWPKEPVKGERYSLHPNYSRAAGEFG